MNKGSLVINVGVDILRFLQEDRNGVSVGCGSCVEALVFLCVDTVRLPIDCPRFILAAGALPIVLRRSFYKDLLCEIPGLLVSKQIVDGVMAC